ncbi:hypothetical protein K2X85_09010 [bacterium]|nr:hypothetical protein [bacterium]
MAMIWTVAGCAYIPPGPPTRFSTTIFKGRIMSAGQPVAVGWVAVYPINATIGEVASARVGPTGEFCIPRAPVGPVAVRITLPRSLREELGRQSPPFGKWLESSASVGTRWRADTTRSEEWWVDLANPGEKPGESLRSEPH